MPSFPLDLDVLRVLVLEGRNVRLARGELRPLLLAKLGQLLFGGLGLDQRALGAALEVLAGLLRLLLVGLERIDLVLALGELALLLEDLVVEIRLEPLERERLVADVDDLLVFLREHFAKRESLLVLFVERLAQIEEIAARHAALRAGRPRGACSHEARFEILVVLTEPLDLAGIHGAGILRRARGLGACVIESFLEVADLRLSCLHVALEAGRELRRAVVGRRRARADARRTITRTRNGRFAHRTQRRVERRSAVDALHQIAGDRRTRGAPSTGTLRRHLLDDDIAVVDLLGRIAAARRRVTGEMIGLRLVGGRLLWRAIILRGGAAVSGLQRDEGLDARQQVVERDGFVDVVLGARPQLAMLLERLVAGLARHDDERDVLQGRVLLELVADGEPVHARQLDGQ